MATAFNVNLQHTKPMALHYHTNGGGRDSYIYADNGGFSMPQFGSHDPGPGTMPPSKVYASPIGSQKYSPTKSKPIHYVQNGQGRDSYISNTHGGFMSPHVVGPGKGTFFNRLRAYDRSQNRSMSRSPSLQSLSPRDKESSPMRLFEEHTDAKADHFQAGQNLITDKRSIASILKTRKEQKQLTEKLAKPRARPQRVHQYQSFRFGRMLELDDGDPMASSGFVSGSRALADGSRYTNVLAESRNPNFLREKRATLGHSGLRALKPTSGLDDAFRNSGAVKYAEKLQKRRGDNPRHKSVSRQVSYQAASRSKLEGAQSTVLPDIYQKPSTLALLNYEDALRNMTDLQIGPSEAEDKALSKV